MTDLRLFDRGRIQIYGDTAEVGARVKCRQTEQLTAASNVVTKKFADESKQNQNRIASIRVMKVGIELRPAEFRSRWSSRATYIDAKAEIF